MRFFNTSLVALAVALAITGCGGGKSSSSNSGSDQSAAAASAAPAVNEIPAYPGAVTQASGSGSNMGTTAAGKVMSTGDSFDKVYGWYQQKLPAGSERNRTWTRPSRVLFSRSARLARGKAPLPSLLRAARRSSRSRTSRCSLRTTFQTGLLQVGLRDIRQFVRAKPMLHQFAVLFLVSNDHGSRVDLDDLAFDSEILDRDVVAVPQVRHTPVI